MGLLFIACLLLLAANALGFGKKSEDFLSRDMTCTVNGYFLTTVFMTHIIQYLSSDLYNEADWLYIYINRALGQLIVAMFLFYSGFGVMESVKHKANYMRTFPVKRILLLAFDFEIAVVIYFALSCLTGQAPTFLYTVKAIFAWESLGNSNWYVFAILYLYLASYLAFRFIKPRYTVVSLFLMIAFVTFYIFFMSRHKGGWWYDTVMCYPAGMAFSRYADKIRAYLTGSAGRYISWLAVLGCAFAAVYTCRRQNVWFFELLSVLFALLVVTLTARFRATGRFYGYLGKHLFCFYIYQRVPMVLFEESIGANHVYAYFFVCIAGTALLGVLMTKVYEQLHKKYFAFFQKYLPHLIQ